MARMMAKSRRYKAGWRYCCQGHDPNWYVKSGQRAKEKRQWLKDAE